MRSGVLFLALSLAVAILVEPKVLFAGDERFPAPPPEIDAGPPPLVRAPVRSRRPVEVVAGGLWLLPTCRDGSNYERCRALGSMLGGALAALYRPNPYFAFGGGVSLLEASTLDARGKLSGSGFGVGADGRVYLYEEGAFDPYLELHLGYASLRTRLIAPGGARFEDVAFGPAVRAGGGLDAVVFSSLKLGGSAGFSQLLFERGERCSIGRCAGGSAPSGAILGGWFFALRATALFGSPL